MVAGGRDGSVRFLDLAPGRARTASGRHDGAVITAAFSADGRTAVTAGEDGRVIVWDVDRAAAAETLAGPRGRDHRPRDHQRRPHALHRRASTAR